MNDLNINKGHCFIKKKGSYHRIAIKDIFYIKSEGDYCLIQTVSGQFLHTTTLSELELLFGEDGFFRVHRSYLLNMKSITAIDIEQNLIKIGEQAIPISRATKKAFLNKFRLID